MLRFYSKSKNVNFWQNFEIFRPWPWKKIYSSRWILSVLSTNVTSMRGCVAYNDGWPWPIPSRSFGLGLENRVCSAASTVLDKFFPYLIQMITSRRRCVACDDLWPWPISSRSFDLEFEYRVRSVTFSVLARLFPHLPQIITTIWGCVACQVYNKILKFQFFRWHRLIYLFYHKCHCNTTAWSRKNSHCMRMPKENLMASILNGQHIPITHHVMQKCDG